MSNGEDNKYEFDGVFETIPCQDAEQLLNTITDRSRPWNQSDTLTWIARGQNDHRWLLEPSVYRLPSQSFNTAVDYNLVEHYVRTGNIERLDIPSDTKLIQYADTLVNRQLVSGERQWKLDGAHFAHAQHHGIPTRLLDFSYNALVAAWFAADFTEAALSIFGLSGRGTHMLDRVADLINQISRENNIKAFIKRANQLLNDTTLVIWIINTEHLEAKTNLRVVDIAYTQIDFLRAQSGCFLVDISAPGSKLWKNEIAFEYELQKLDRGEVFRITLPSKLRGALVNGLASFNIRNTSIFPDWRTIASDVAQGIRNDLSIHQIPSVHKVKFKPGGYSFTSPTEVVQEGEEHIVAIPQHLAQHDPNLPNCGARVLPVSKLDKNANDDEIWFAIEGIKLCTRILRKVDGNYEPISLRNSNDEQHGISARVFCVHEDGAEVGNIAFKNCLGEDAEMQFSLSEII